MAGHFLVDNYFISLNIVNHKPSTKLLISKNKMSVLPILNIISHHLTISVILPDNEIKS